MKKAETKPKFLLIVNKNTNIPYLLEGGNVSVKGEVYEIEDRFLENLDSFESEYIRKEIFYLPDCKKSWCYIAPLKILSDGVY